MKLSEIASLVQGEIFGDPALEITGVAGITEAKEGDITFFAGQRHRNALLSSKASCVMVQEFLSDLAVAQLKVSNPYLAFARLLALFYVKPVRPSGISPDAHVSDKARVASDVSISPLSLISDGVSIGAGSVISPFVFIGENSVIGERCIVYPMVTIREGVTIGNNVIIHSGTVIGSDGFGYVFANGQHHKIPQVGGVVIGDDVEIGANVTIDRATTGKTVIGRGTKIDNLVQIGHNVTIGEHCLIVAQVGIGGSSVLGDFVTLAGQVGIADHVEIETGTIIGAQSGVMGKVAKGAYTGTPAMHHRDWLKAQAIFAKLPELQKKIRELEGKLSELERRNISC